MLHHKTEYLHPLAEHQNSGSATLVPENFTIAQKANKDTTGPYL